MSIVLTNLTKRFGRVLVVNNVSLSIPEGELFVLLGGSGSGKSTILRMIAGLTEVDSGRIELGGRDVTDLPPQARNVGFVFQNYSIFRHMTVAENVEFGLRIRGAPAAERQQRRDELLELVGLTGLGDRYSNQLSGGQQQRVALARALAYQPEVLLLDEPFGALDVKIRAQLRASLKEIQKRLGITTILVTHDQEEAFELADRIGLIERGSLIEVGTPQDLYYRPQTEYTAVFIGGGNVLVGRNVDNAISLGSVRLPFPEEAPVHEPGAPVRVMFRPETVVVKSSPDQMGQAHVLGRGRVIEQVFTGPARRMRLEIEGLQGVRPLVPPPAYGQLAAQIEALVPGSEAEAISSSAVGELWVGLTDYHVLAPTGPKILICSDGSAVDEAAAFGMRLARAAHGPATLLAVVPASGEVAAARARLESLIEQQGMQGHSQLVASVRQGIAHAEILTETQEGSYEMVVLGRSPDAAGRPLGIGTTGQEILAQARVPVMLVSSGRSTIERILICTAAGEPGKSDVLFGGRLARWTGAFATIFHVHAAGAPAHERTRSEKHLRQAQRSLEMLGVKSECAIGDGEPLRVILEKAEAGDYDLLVIGAPAPRVPQRFVWRDLATQIVAGTQRPVVVVPMQER